MVNLVLRTQPHPQFLKWFKHLVDCSVCIITQEARWPSGTASGSGANGQGFDPHSGRRVVSLSKIHLPSK